MSDRSQTGHTGSHGPQSYDSDAEYWFAEKPTYMWSGRIRGLDAGELVEWVQHIPNKGHVIQDIEIRRDELTKMNEIDQQGWGKALTQANTKTFEAFVDREQRVEWLTAILEAEASRDDVRAERIAYVNQRKAEL